MDSLSKGILYIVFRLGVAIRSEFWRLTKKTASEPRTMPLPLVRHHLYLQPATFSSSTFRLRCPNPVIHKVLYIAL